MLTELFPILENSFSNFDIEMRCYINRTEYPENSLLYSNNCDFSFIFGIKEKNSLNKLNFLTISFLKYYFKSFFDLEWKNFIIEELTIKNSDPYKLQDILDSIFSVMNYKQIKKLEIYNSYRSINPITYNIDFNKYIDSSIEHLVFESLSFFNLYNLSLLPNLN